ncbi:hypothetical protein [Paenibacillus sp. GCM10012306]|uniref:hypothetical protein n=1 Tax=Paenibacillus sp. GCM10012306 TaxID=3317342 RepID=UPI00361EC409
MELDKAICSSIGNYENALTKGKKYEILAEKEEKIRIVGDHGRSVWIDKYYFNFTDEEVHILTDWKFDDDLETMEFIEITLTFNDRVKRWCIITTPDKLKQHFARQAALELPGIHIGHLIIVQTIDVDTVNAFLREMDDQGELLNASLPLDEVSEDEDVSGLS